MLFFLISRAINWRKWLSTQDLNSTFLSFSVFMIGFGIQHSRRLRFNCLYRNKSFFLTFPNYLSFVLNWFSLSLERKAEPSTERARLDFFGWIFLSWDLACRGVNNKKWLELDWKICEVWFKMIRKSGKGKRYLLRRFISSFSHQIWLNKVNNHSKLQIFVR